MEWISVKDKLPTGGARIIVAHRLGVREGIYLYGVFYPRYGLTPLQVTHWMPLPEPPKPDTSINDNLTINEKP